MSTTEGPIRKAYIGALEDIADQVSRLFAMVSEGLAGATDAFLGNDTDQARAVVDRDADIDALEAEIEQEIERVMLIQAPVAGDFHRLVCALRIVPELERSGDLAEHIASRAARGLGAKLPP